MYERILSMCVDNRVSLPGNFVLVSTVLQQKIMKVKQDHCFSISYREGSDVNLAAFSF